MEATGCRIVTYGKQDSEFSIYDIADVHWLNRGCHKAALYRDIEKIRKDPYSLWVEGGDYADWIFPGDKRFDWEAIDSDLRAVDMSHFAAIVAKGVVNLFNPIASKCLGFCMGNHDIKYLSKASLMNIHEEICGALGVTNMRYSGWFDIYFCHQPGTKGVTVRTSDTPPKSFTARLRVFVHHGAGAANTAGGKINRLKALVDMVDADLVCMGHVHEQMAKAFLRLSPNADCSEIGQKVTMGMITGSYLRTYASDFTGYGEAKAYAPATIGATRARYRPGDLSLTVENRADNVGLKG